MKPSYEMNEVLQSQYGYQEDLHGYYMDAPSLMPLGSMSGWTWRHPTMIERKGN